ncbi:hypothetical protein KRP22_007426 [Phytophthora ramorum]|nr:hypothetical protein KRP22_4563 [Phytophthora ramorum]
MDMRPNALRSQVGTWGSDPQSTRQRSTHRHQRRPQELTAHSRIQNWVILVCRRDIDQGSVDCVGGGQRCLSDRARTLDGVVRNYFGGEYMVVSPCNAAKARQLEAAPARVNRFDEPNGAVTGAVYLRISRALFNATLRASVLKLWAVEEGVYAGLFFVLRLSRTGDAISPSIAQQGPANERSGDGMMLPFMGVNVARSYLDMAEADAHAKLTQLCLT